jgi:heme-degrading monooxygenase HmoA
MFSVIFEVHPYPERFQDYLQLAGRLKPILEGIDGFVDNERFESLSRPGWLLSHSTWRDEKSVIRWRSQGEHHGVQARGRAEIFQDYRLRVGEITSDSALPPGMSIQDQRLDETEVGTAKLATLTEITPRESGAFGSGAELLPGQLGLERPGGDMVEYEIFASIYNPGKLILLAGWKTAGAGKAWRPHLPQDTKELRHRAVRIVREYGMFDRRETPQYHAPARRPA